MELANDISLGWQYDLRSEDMNLNPSKVQHPNVHHPVAQSDLLGPHRLHKSVQSHPPFPMGPFPLHLSCSQNMVGWHPWPQRFSTEVTWHHMMIAQPRIRVTVSRVFMKLVSRHNGRLEKSMAEIYWGASGFLLWNLLCSLLTLWHLLMASIHPLQFHIPSIIQGIWASLGRFSYLECSPLHTPWLHWDYRRWLCCAVLIQLWICIVGL